MPTLKTMWLAHQRLSLFYSYLFDNHITEKHPICWDSKRPMKRT